MQTGKQESSRGRRGGELSLQGASYRRIVIQLGNTDLRVPFDVEGNHMHEAEKFQRVCEAHQTRHRRGMMSDVPVIGFGHIGKKMD